MSPARDGGMTRTQEATVRNARRVIVRARMALDPALVGEDGRALLQPEAADQAGKIFGAVR